MGKLFQSFTRIGRLLKAWRAYNNWENRDRNDGAEKYKSSFGCRDCSRCQKSGRL